MRRFLITSPNFSGQAEIVFKEDGMLCSINFKEAQLNRAITSSFKRIVPDHISDLETAFKNTKATIIESDFEVTFDMFWEKYNKKINRKRCMPLWNKLSKAKQVKAHFGITQYDKYLEKEKWRTKADPETYLRNEMFDNEWQ